MKWFIQNTSIQNHSKIYQLPIGLDYHTISNNSSSPWKMPGEGIFPCNQETTLVNIRNTMKPFYERIPKIYVNFNKNNDRFNHRKKSLDNIDPNLIINQLSFIPRTITWKNILNYTFVLSPFGNGMDCHRTWEVLCLGAIPIVKAPNFTRLFQDLPVLNVNNWSDINETLLNDTIADFKNKVFNYEKLELKYWINLIKSN